MLQYKGMKNLIFVSIINHKYQKAEVSGIDWFPLEQCLDMIRPYNLEKKRLIQSVDNCLHSNFMFSVNKK